MPRKLPKIGYGESKYPKLKKNDSILTDKGPSDKKNPIRKEK